MRYFFISILCVQSAFGDSLQRNDMKTSLNHEREQCVSIHNGYLNYACSNVLNVHTDPLLDTINNASQSCRIKPDGVIVCDKP